MGGVAFSLRRGILVINPVADARAAAKCLIGVGCAVMHNEFTAIVERDNEWFITYSPEVPGANGQGRSRDEALASLRDAIALILEDRREDGLRGVPADADRTVVTVE
jgi:predicted RNase H-like HicB family nuclease